jgi:hypothetical protein
MIPSCSLPDPFLLLSNPLFLLLFFFKIRKDQEKRVK